MSAAVGGELLLDLTCCFAGETVPVECKVFVDTKTNISCRYRVHCIARALAAVLTNIHNDNKDDAGSSCGTVV